MWKRRTFVIIFVLYLAIVVFLAVSSIESTQAQPPQPKHPCTMNVQHFDYSCLVRP